MITRLIDTKSGRIAVAHSDKPVLTDGQSALEFAVNIGYENECRAIIVNKEAIAEGFFQLSTGIAGEIAQKFVNFGYRLAIVGDFSGYRSKALRDYMTECNRGAHICFVASQEEAIAKLGGPERV